MMRHAAPFCKRHFGRGDLDLAIDLHRIAIDNLARESQRECDAEFALARSGRADDGDDRLLWRWVCCHVLCSSKRRMMTSQMTTSSTNAPASCLREKRIRSLKAETRLTLARPV